MHNSTILDELEKEYDDIRDKVLEIKADNPTADYHELFDELVKAADKIDILLGS